MQEKQVNLTLKIIEADTPTLKGYVYPKQVLEEAVAKYSEQMKISLGMEGLGEIDSSESTLNLSRVSHQLKNIRFDGNSLVADVFPFNTPCGLILRDIIWEDAQENKIPPLRLGLRGIGKADENGVVSEYSIIAIDILPDRMNKNV